MNPRGLDKIEHAVETAAAPQDHPQALRHLDVLRTMPRRQPLKAKDSTLVNWPAARRVAFSPGKIRPFLRLIIWLWACIRFFGGNALDWLSDRASTQRSAVRLREIFDGAGVSFAKLAQQLSLRADLLP